MLKIAPRKRPTSSKQTKVEAKNQSANIRVNSGNIFKTARPYISKFCSFSSLINGLLGSRIAKCSVVHANSRGFLSVNHLDEEEPPELLVVGEDGRVGEAGAEQRDALLTEDTEVVAVRLLDVGDQGVHVCEVGLYEHGLELGHVGEAAVQEDDVHDVVAYVTLPLNLKYNRRINIKHISSIFPPMTPFLS